MTNPESLAGFLDVKISNKSRRGLTPWKAWQKQWCEITRLDSIESGIKLVLKTSAEGTLLNSLTLPRSSTICRTESRTKQYAFCVITLGRNHKPILYLSGSSESGAQKWMSAIRRMLCIATYLPVGESNYHVSLVDTDHSRAAGLFGLHGVLGINSQELVISDPCTGEPKISFQWYQFHQFHLQAPVQACDEKRIVVMHTSGEFPSGPGQIYLYCQEGERLLQQLINRGKYSRGSPGLTPMKRLSRSEGDLCSSSPDSPLCFRSQTGSDDSGVRVSIVSEDEFGLKQATSFVDIGLMLMTKTPGGSENNDSEQNLTELGLPRRESGVSLCSGIYEEIPEDHQSKPKFHVYENPIEMILNSCNGFKPPPLPPRCNEMEEHLLKQRCNTLPAKDLARISQTFTDSDYVVMSPKAREKKCAVESLYTPMSPINLKAKIVESCYMSMTGRKA